MTKIPTDEWKLCNCAECKRTLLSRDHEGKIVAPPYEYVAGRVADRPYCATCLPSKTKA